MKIHRADFYPLVSLDNKRNYKRLFRIERDGSIHESVHLSVSSPEHREHLIFLHYLSHMGRFLLKKDTGINIISRDNPWDYRIELNNEFSFNIEITSIANSQENFVINRSEEQFMHWRSQDTITLRSLEKIAKLFPNPDLMREIAFYKNLGYSRNSRILNPVRDDGAPIFLSATKTYPGFLEDKIKNAIQSKTNKLHADKFETTLIIDNRTSGFSIAEYRSAVDLIDDFLKIVTFPEIWLYTGYFSDDDGRNAEYSFSPIKLPVDWAEAVDSLRVDSRGIHVWEG